MLTLLLNLIGFCTVKLRRNIFFYQSIETFPTPYLEKLVISLLGEGIESVISLRFMGIPRGVSPPNPEFFKVSYYLEWSIGA